jgi:phage terminase large subunit-like protein
LLPESERTAILRQFSEDECREIVYDWRLNARPKQLQPGTPGAAIDRTDWLFWIALAGRGWGKTLVGAQTVREWANDPTERILMVAPTAADVYEVMIYGPSGLMSCYPPDRKPSYNSSHHEISFPSGAVGITRSAEEPDRLRGPQFTKFWFDELAACQRAKEAWDQIMYGFRIPTPKLRGLVTTTPKPIDTLKAILANPRTVVTRGSSDENMSNLAPEYISHVIDPYRGTRLGRQEIDAELLEDVPGALWKRVIIDATRIRPEEIHWDAIIRIVIAVDPAVSHSEDSDETGIVVGALLRSGHALILDDLSCRESALGWAQVVKAAYKTRRADMVVGEVNNGGDLVERNISALDKTIPFRKIWASHGKQLRAEPVANLYEQGRIHHVGCFLTLEEQMVTWTPRSGTKSPDRLDAMVYAITELLLDPEESEFTFPVGQMAQISPI